MGRLVPKGTPVVWVNEHPAVEGSGYFTLAVTDVNDHTNAEFGEEVQWVKENDDSEDNLGHWEYREG